MKLEKYLDKFKKKLKDTNDRAVYQKYAKKLIYKIRKKLKKDSRNIALINLCGILALEMNNVDLACSMFKRAVHIDANIETLNNIAYFYLREYDDSDRAVTILRKSLDMNPMSEFPFALLGEAYIDLQQYDKAGLFLKKACELNPTLEILNNLGVAVYMQQRVQESLVYFERGLKYKYNVETLLSYGMCLAKVGEKKKAEKVAMELSCILERFLQTGERLIYSDVSFIDIAELYYEINNYNMASEFFHQESKYFTGDYLGMYLYSLIKCKKDIEAKNLCNDFRARIEIEILELKEEYTCYSEDDIKYFEDKYSREVEELFVIYEKIKKGYRPEVNFIPRVLSCCYLFGCVRHDN